MFGISFLSKPVLIIGGVIIIIGMLGTAYAHVDGLKDDIRTLSENNLILEDAVKTQNDTLDSIKSDLELQASINEAFANELQSSAATISRLRRDLRSTTSKLSALDVDKAEPGVIVDIEKDINSRYNNLLKCFGKETSDECIENPSGQ